MSMNHVNYSAMKSLQVYLSAQNNPDALRVTETGDLTIASEATLLFERASRSLWGEQGKTHTAADWSRKAHDALTGKFEKELAHISGKTLSPADKKDLEELLANIKMAKTTENSASLRQVISTGLESLKLKNEQLATSLEKIVFLENPDNSKILPYVQPHISAGKSLRTILENGLTDYLQQDMGMNKSHSKGLAENLSHLMISYETTIDESLAILKLAGQMKNTKKFPEKDLLPLAFLRIHHNLTLDRSLVTKKIIESQTVNDKPVQIRDARTEIALMLTYPVTFETAHAIAKQAAELRKNPRLESISNAQLKEIAKLMAENKKTFKDAKTISLQAGIMQGDLPANRNHMLNELVASLDSYKHKKLAESLPAGWDDKQMWSVLPDGSRQLKDTEKFGKDLMSYLVGSFAAHPIDENNGLSKLFMNDVGRQKFNFGGGETGTIIRTDANQALSELEKFTPDTEVRKTLSRALFQAGGNGIVSAMSTALKRGEDLFSIVSSDGEDKLPNAGSDFWLDLQHTDDGKIRVTYTNYMKHIGMIDPGSDQNFMSINPKLSRNTPASAADHSAKGIVTIELDPEQLKQGIIEPRMVGEPFLSLKIDIR